MPPRVPHKIIDGVEHKHCARCKEYLILNKFGISRHMWDDLRSMCKTCRRQYAKEFRIKNKEKMRAKEKNWRSKNIEKCRAYGKKYYKNNPGKYKGYGKKYYNNNKKKVCARIYAYKKKKYHSDIKYRLVTLLRGRLLGALKAQGVYKTKTTMKLCGCSLEKLKQHLESQFTEGMSWENKGEWHIDHIKPCAAFDLSDVEQQKECFHFTNLQPLWAIDNIRKGAKY